MNTIKIPEGWYEITGQPTRDAGDKFSFQGKWHEITPNTASNEQLEGFRYIRRIPSQQDDLAKQVAALTRQLNYLPSTASETASNGILAAVKDIAYTWALGSHSYPEIEAIISRHCVGKEMWCHNMLQDLNDKLMGRIATEKARADNLQAELDHANSTIAVIRQAIS